MQRIDGAVPAYKDCKWVCSTGLFQLAVIWFKMGNYHRGDMAFDYGVRLQNNSGGWFGGYCGDFIYGPIRLHDYTLIGKINYFPNEEISWAVKYFFDAFYYRQRLQFKEKANSFISHIDSKDIKYVTIEKEVKKLSLVPLKILDVGCGKGRYLNKLSTFYPDNEYFGVDLSEEVLKYVKNPNVHLKPSSILNIEYKNDKFDIVYATESLEHSVLLKNAVVEMVRVLKPGGTLIIIDKDSDSFEEVKYASWIDPKELSTKQWLDTEKMIKMLKHIGLNDIQTYVLPTVEGNMYRAYIGRKAEND